MIERYWFSIAILLLLLGLALKQSLLLLASALFLLTFATAHLWNHFCLNRLSYERKLSENRIFFGEAVSLEVKITNDKLLPLPWVRVDDLFPHKLTLQEGKLESTNRPKEKILSNLFTLGPYHAVTRRYRVHGTRRGIYQFGPATLHSGDLFGIFKQSANVLQANNLTVYPQIFPLEKFKISADQLFGDIRVHKHLYQDPVYPVSVRQYMSGDSPRHINWRASARMPDLQTKVFDHNVTLQLSLFLDVRTVERPYWGADPDLMDQTASIAASLAYASLMRGYAISFAANEIKPTAIGFSLIRVPSGSHRNQLPAVLEALASIQSVEAVPLEKMIRRDYKRLAPGATVVVITPVPEQNQINLLTNIKSTGLKVFLIIVGNKTAGITSTRNLPVLYIDDEFTAVNAENNLVVMS